MGAGSDRRALSAAFNYLIIGAIGATFYVIGVGFLYAITGTLNIVDLATRFTDIGGSAALYAGFGFIVAGIMVKAAVFPVHIWLPGVTPDAVVQLLPTVMLPIGIVTKMLREIDEEGGQARSPERLDCGNMD